MNEKREGRMLYRCHAKGCSFATDNLGTFIHHVLDEKLSKTTPNVELQKPKIHRTVQEHLSCPVCYPRFEKAMLANPKVLEELEKRGWKKKERFDLEI